MKPIENCSKNTPRNKNSSRDQLNDIKNTSLTWNTAKLCYVGMNMFEGFLCKSTIGGWQTSLEYA